LSFLRLELSLSLSVEETRRLVKPEGEMGVSQRIYVWMSIQPQATVGLWIHGYAHNEFVAYSGTSCLASNVPPAAVNVKAKISVEGTGPHVDGTVGRLIHVANNAVGPQPYIACEVSHFRDYF
jgi:hypothetical protein